MGLGEGEEPYGQERVKIRVGVGKRPYRQVHINKGVSAPPGGGDLAAGRAFVYQKKIETNQIWIMDLLRFREKPINSRPYMKEPTVRHEKRQR